MGQVTVRIKVENLFDRVFARRRKVNGRAPAKVRSIVIPDALVDTGATDLCLSRSCIKRLGLPFRRRVRSRTATGIAHFRLYAGALLTVQGREQECNVLELPGKAPALVGVIPLEGLDLTVDPVARRLVGKHGKQRTTLLYRTA